MSAFDKWWDAEGSESIAALGYMSPREIAEKAFIAGIEASLGMLSINQIKRDEHSFIDNNGNICYCACANPSKHGKPAREVERYAPFFGTTIIK